METKDVDSTISQLGVTPTDVRIAIRQAVNALNKIVGFVPINVGIPLESARGKLLVASIAIDAWESDLRLNAVMSKYHDWCADYSCPRCNLRREVEQNKDTCEKTIESD